MSILFISESTESLIKRRQKEETNSQKVIKRKKNTCFGKLTFSRNFFFFFE